MKIFILGLVSTEVCPCFTPSWHVGLEGPGTETWSGQVHTAVGESCTSLHQNATDKVEWEASLDCAQPPLCFEGNRERRCVQLHPRMVSRAFTEVVHWTVFFFVVVFLVFGFCLFFFFCFCFWLLFSNHHLWLYGICSCVNLFNRKVLFPHVISAGYVCSYVPLRCIMHCCKSLHFNYIVVQCPMLSGTFSALGTYIAVHGQ